MLEKEKKGEREFAGKAVRFTARFAVIFAVLYAILLATEFEGMQSALAGLEAGLVGGEASGNTVFAGGHGFEVTQSCLGLFSAIIFASIVFACRKPGAPKKLGIAAAGSAVLLLANIPRLYAVIMAGKLFGPETAELVHVLTWFAMTAVIIALWHYSAKKIAGREFGELI